MLHFGTVLGSAWQVVLYTDMEKWRMPTAHAFQRAIKLGQIQIRFLPKDTNLTDDTSKSRFLTKPWLWQQLESAPRVLVFQKDSIICSNSALAIENFLPYDFLGPIISEGHGQGYSGGLSIRNPSLFLKIANESDFEVDGDSSEEEWFYKKIKERPDAILPNADVAKAFAVRTSYYDQPVGYLQPSRWQATKMDKIEAYCPEVKQLMGH
ncbi:hypothetical protein GQ53DRAFT_721626 [Thozetella sp. PMI_491]|nr:hypothetical protein GQ53DRAFT_721626 [Thozetella sp. PMI_491]